MLMGGPKISVLRGGLVVGSKSDVQSTVKVFVSPGAPVVHISHLWRALGFGEVGDAEDVCRFLFEFFRLDRLGIPIRFKMKIFQKQMASATGGVLKLKLMLSGKNGHIHNDYNLRRRSEDTAGQGHEVGEDSPVFLAKLG